MLHGDFFAQHITQLTSLLYFVIDFNFKICPIYVDGNASISSPTSLAEYLFVIDGVNPRENLAENYALYYQLFLYVVKHRDATSHSFTHILNFFIRS